MGSQIIQGLSTLCISLAALSLFAALVIWGINKWGDQGGVGEKAMTGAIGAGVAFGIAAGFITAVGPTIFAGI